MPYKDKADQAEAAHRYYESHKSLMKSRAKAYSKEHYKVLRELVCTSKSRPCMDCGISYPSFVMDFDHLRDKEDDIANLAKRKVSVARLQAEIDKCDVVCANCHRLRTHSRLADSSLPQSLSSG